MDNAAEGMAPAPTRSVFDYVAGFNAMLRWDKEKQNPVHVH